MTCGTYKKILGSTALLLFIAGTCWTSPTGLNNIPTTDVAGDRTFVWQCWLTTSSDAKPAWTTGFKYGILDRMEIGSDSRLGAGDAGPVALQGKLKVFDFDFGFSGLVGVEGITFEGEIDDDIVPYFAVSQEIGLNEDLQLFRLHGGYSFQDDNFGIFTGVDRAFEVYDEEIILRGDAKQVNDSDDLLISGGILLTLPFNLALESWLSIPTESGAEESVTIKLNYIMKF